jgi:hypothetical protein
MLFSDYSNSIKKARKATINIVALFFIVFALADVSVLQAYHGNELVGIPAEHHNVQDNDCIAEKTQLNSSHDKQTRISAHNQHNNSNEDCSGEGECLAGCSHIIVSYFVFNPCLQYEIIKPQPTSFHENTIPKSEPTAIFHPPKTA